MDSKICSLVVSVADFVWTFMVTYVDCDGMIYMYGSSLFLRLQMICVGC